MRRHRKGGVRFRQDTPPVKRARVNGEIKAQTILVIDATGEQLGERSLPDALRLAAEAELDLVEVAAGGTAAGLPHRRLRQVPLRRRAEGEARTSQPGASRGQGGAAAAEDRRARLRLEARSGAGLPRAERQGEDRRHLPRTGARAARTADGSCSTASQRRSPRTAPSSRRRPSRGGRCSWSSPRRERVAW